MAPTKEMIYVKWIYKLKFKPNDYISKYNEMLVAMKFLQKTRTNFNEVYALGSRLETIRIRLVIATFKGWKMHQLNVRLTFLNGSLKDVYFKQPPDFEIKGQ